MLFKYLMILLGILVSIVLLISGIYYVLSAIHLMNPMLFKGVMLYIVGNIMLEISSVYLK